ncbi:hypothetical protein Vadar_013570 [Vaccinium darrowii]|uniref:Uncharacterized protein n=1 Tax=Vaccinium darrowii TaxID=229202 RepID=A0ACB7YLP2_9ERIC|nr:hypothetical protein Vadar_013570 [Vaccinium darrowii]
MNKWREALTEVANLSGWDLPKGTEAVKGIQVNAKPFDQKMDKLRYHESILEVQNDSLGTEAVGGRLLYFNDPKDVQVNAKGFNKMYNLWLLHLDYVHLTTDFEHISRRLLWLSWKGFPLECLPWNLSTEKLIALDLSYSCLKKVWSGYKASSCLKELKLANCSLSYLPDEIGNLISLQSLDLQQNNLITIPDRICNLTCLKFLDLACNNVSRLPSEIGRLTSLEYLNLGFLTEIEALTSLKNLRHQCKRSLALPLPDSIWSLTRLRRLILDGCNLSHLPSEIGNLASLYKLSLRVNNICTLPDSIRNLHRLQYLFLRNCEKLQSLPKLPTGCEVSADDCKSLESLPLELDQLGQNMFCSGSNKLVENDFANRLLKQLHRSKGLAELENVVNILVPTGGDDPTQFPYQGRGSYISFVVPPLVKHKMLGWVICVFFTGPGEGVLPFVSMEHRVICNKIEKERVYSNTVHCYFPPTCQDHVWLRYTPQGFSGLHLKDGDEVEISILSHHASLVKSWGVDLIYEVDENITKTNENQEALIQYTPTLYENVRQPARRFYLAN